MTVAVVSGLLFSPLLWRAGWLGSYVAGWGLMVLIGVAGGAWLVVRHGRPNATFLLVLFACILARLLATLGGAAVLWLKGRPPWGYLLGIAVGYVPLQTYEGLWFYRTSRMSMNDLMAGFGLGPGAERPARSIRENGKG